MSENRDVKFSLLNTGNSSKLIIGKKDCLVNNLAMNSNKKQKIENFNFNIQI